MIRACSLWLKQFGQDRQGLAAIEFALLAPIMILIYFGMTEFSQAYMANRRANHVAAIVADLVAQGEVTSRADIALTAEIGDLVIAPFSAETLSTRITSVTLDGDDNAIIDWSRAHGTGLTALVKGAQFTDLPTGMITEGQSLIVGESHYVYSSRLSTVIKQPMVFTRTYYLRPRSVDMISCTDC